MFGRSLLVERKDLMWRLRARQEDLLVLEMLNGAQTLEGPIDHDG